LWSKPRAGGAPQDAPPSREEIEAASRRAGAENPEAAGEALIRAKRCGRCHPGLPEPAAAEVSLAAPYPGKGCLSGKTLPRFALDPETRRVLDRYLAEARLDRHPSAFDSGRRLLDRHGCFRCHARDAERPSPLEEAASTAGGSLLETVPFQRTPRLDHAHLKYTGTYLLSSIQDGVT